MGSPFGDPSKKPSPGQKIARLFLLACRNDRATDGREIGCVEANAPWGAAPDRANVSFAPGISATTLSEAINAQYILYVMARTIRWLLGSPPGDARPGLGCPQTYN